MLLKLTRIDATDHGIFGKLETDGFNCVTLERHDIAIAPGIYKITLYQSPEHGLVPLLHDVPNSSFVEMHEGNWEFNSKKCILVGRARWIIEGKDGIGQSKDTLHSLVQLIQAHPQEEIQISIS